MESQPTQVQVHIHHQILLFYQHSGYQTIIHPIRLNIKEYADYFRKIKKKPEHTIVMNVQLNKRNKE